MRVEPLVRCIDLLEFFLSLEPKTGIVRKAVGVPNLDEIGSGLLDFGELRTGRQTQNRKHLCCRSIDCGWHVFHAGLKAKGSEYLDRPLFLASLVYRPEA